MNLLNSQTFAVGNSRGLKYQWILRHRRYSSLGTDRNRRIEYFGV